MTLLIDFVAGQAQSEPQNRGKPLITLKQLLDAAIDLRGDAGLPGAPTNTEYDRALVQLIANVMPGDYDAAKAYVATTLGIEEEQ